MSYNDFLPEPVDRSRRAKRGKVQRDESTGKIVAEVKAKGLMVQGVMAASAHLMDMTADLDDHRKQLAGQDEALNVLLSSVEKRAILKAGRITDSLFEKFD